jgi:hypothetical protein
MMIMMMNNYNHNKNIYRRIQIPFPSLVKPISNIVIRDENDIYNILTNREKLELLVQEYENYHRLDKGEGCCDENTPCVNSNNKDKLLTDTNLLVGSSQYQTKYQDNTDYLHKGENHHSKNTEEDDELSIEHLKPDLKAKIKEELEKSKREQLILLKDNKLNIIDFLLGNKNSIKVEDLKIYEPVYKCYRKKGNCFICNTLSNIICINRNNCNGSNRVWLCTNHWKQHIIEKHKYQI